MGKLTVSGLIGVGVLVTMFAAKVNAGTTVLDPGPGTDYLGVSCGGQQVNEIATGFDAAANAVTLVKVTTTCHGSGRGSPNQYYLACWTVGFTQDGSIQSKLSLGSFHWVQGNPPIPCPVPADPTAVYTHTDGAGNFPVTLSTTMVGTSSSVYRAVLETACSPIKFGSTVSGTISAEGEQDCYPFSGVAGDGVRVSVANTSGTLFPVQEIRRPDGSLRCTGNVDCTLDATGLHTIVVRDSTGSGTGDYDMALTCLTPACGPGPRVPHLTIGMTAALTRVRTIPTLDYTITVGNDGTASAVSVVLQDTLPQGLLVRSISSTQGTCSQIQKTILCGLGSLAPSGSVVIDITTTPVSVTGQVTNTACVNTTTCASAVTSFPD